MPPFNASLSKPAKTPIFSKTGLFFVFLLAAVVLHAQSYSPVIRPQQGNQQPLSMPCGFVQPKTLEEQQRLAAFEKTVLSKQTSRQQTVDLTTVYRLPVVFHIVHNNGAENIPDANITTSLSLLNDAFANSNTFNAGGGVDTRIMFCLGRNLASSNTNGITRTVSPLTNMVMENDDDALKAVMHWDATKYINIWVVNSINSTVQGPGVAGYAYLPSAHGANYDGIVIEASFLSGNKNNLKVLVHEMGHYLGLYHSFEGGCKNDDCQQDGDKVCDTPPDANTATFANCLSGINSCNSDTADASTNNPFRAVLLGGLGDQPDMLTNYMDYSGLDCPDKFTEGQKVRMRNAITIARASLLLDNSLCSTCRISGSSFINVPDTIPAGLPTVFSLQPTPASDMLLFWTIDGQSFSNQATASVTITKQHHFDASVLVVDGQNGCHATYSKSIFAQCAGTPPNFSVSPNSSLDNPGDVLQFQAVTTAVSYSWNVDGIQAGTGSSFNYTIINNTPVLVTLVANNGTCSMESQPHLIQPGNCREAGKENNTWFFGFGAGLNFDSSKVTPIHSPLPIFPIGTLAFGPDIVVEGSAVISNANGTPLYYSAGNKVSNCQTGNVLLNGDELYGSVTTTQSALFVPKPNSDRYIYLFTPDWQGGEVGGFSFFGASHEGGLYYSVIDKQGDNGHGAVTQKNRLLAKPVTEKVIAVKNRYGNGVWVIAHEWGTDAFLSWLVSDTGISAAPIISHVGTVHQATADPADSSGANAIGEMKATISGKRIALALYQESTVEAFDFDDLSGKVSNPVKLKDSSVKQPYGLSFSPNGRYLYTTTVSLPYMVVRWDLNAGSTTAINQSLQKVDSGRQHIMYGSIQQAPDGMLYTTELGRNYLSVVANPNAYYVKDCNFGRSMVKLADTSTGQYGLQNLVQTTLFSFAPFIYGPNRLCVKPGQDTVVTYSFNKLGNGVYTWQHRGKNVLQHITDSSADMRFTQAGTDTLILKRAAPCNDLYDTLYIKSAAPQYVNVLRDSAICKGDSIILSAGTGYAAYLWNVTPANPYQVSSYEKRIWESGWHWVELTNEFGCTFRDSAFIQFKQLPAPFNIGNDTTICGSNTLTLSGPTGMDNYHWSTNANTQTITVGDQGTYTLSIEKETCTYKDSVRVWKNIPSNILPFDTLFACNNLSPADSLLKAPSGFTQYRWTKPDGSIVATDTVKVSMPGSYRLAYTSNCGTQEDSVYFYRPVFINETQFITCADSFVINTNYPIEGVGSINGTNSFSAIWGSTQCTVYKKGNYNLYSFFTTNSSPHECLLLQTVQVKLDTALVRPTKQINLGNDTSFCNSGVMPLDAGIGFKDYRWNTGERQQSITAYNLGTYYVNADYCGYSYADTIHIAQKTTGCEAVVPVHLLSFTAQLATAQTAWLQWKTASEINSSHFLVERSTDGIGFQSVGRVNSKGNSSNLSTYGFTDNLSSIPAPIKTVYYRLRAVDRNGDHTYSGIRQIQLPAVQALFSVYPNPATDHFMLYYNGSKATLNITDVLGHTLLTKQLNGTGTYTVNTSTWSRGMYLIRVHNSNTVHTEKILLQ